MKTLSYSVLHLIIFYLEIFLACGLECYVCTDQDENTQKCGNTVEICDFGYTHCLSIIKWKSTQYWSPRAEKQYYITKRCANASSCTSTAENVTLCHHIWYEDWTCSECCQGDRCNYYITLAGGMVKASFHLVVFAFLLSIFMWSLTRQLRLE